MRFEVLLQQREPLLRFPGVAFGVLVKRRIGVAQRRSHMHESNGRTRRDHADRNLRRIETEGAEVGGDDDLLGKRLDTGLDGQHRRVAEL